MDLRVLRYFMAVVREENIVKAAHMLHVTQPTLSRQLQSLEEELGGALFIRGHRGSNMSLTPRGLRLKKRAEEILDLSERTRTEVRGSYDDMRGKIVIGCGESDVMCGIGRVIAKLRHEHPHISVRLLSADAESVNENIERGVIDFGVFIGTVDLSRYDYLKFSFKDSWGLLVNSKTFPEDIEKITPETLKGLPLMVSSQSGVRHTFEPWLGYSYSTLNIVGEYNLIHNAALFCEEGLAPVLTLDRLVNTKGTDLRFIPLEPKLESNTYIGWKKYTYLNPLQSRFLEELKMICVNPGADD